MTPSLGWMDAVSDLKVRSAHRSTEQEVLIVDVHGPTVWRRVPTWIGL